jgi:hypothetical protein
MYGLHGGLILIGITDQDRKIVGVPARRWPGCRSPARNRR